MIDRTDLIGREVKVGDWILQSYTSGRTGDIKIAYVTAIVDNKPGFSAISIRQLERGEWDRTVSPMVWERTGTENHVSGPYKVTYASRSFILDPSVVPAWMQQAAEEWIANGGAASVSI